MEASRSIPPQIPGYTLIKRLGSGSEADVYLYQQLSPARQVAIKISKNTLDHVPRSASVPKRISWGRSPHTPTSFPSMRTA